MMYEVFKESFQNLLKKLSKIFFESDPGNRTKDKHLAKMFQNESDDFSTIVFAQALIAD